MTGRLLEAYAWGRIGEYSSTGSNNYLTALGGGPISGEYDLRVHRDTTGAWTSGL